jgi:hypothetical protein
MSELRNLPWGEKHLCGVYYTVKVSIGYQLYELMLNDLTSIQGIGVVTGQPSKTMKIPKYIVYGVLTQDAFLEYIQVKEKAQAKLLLTKAAELLKSVHNRDLYLNPKKHEETEKLNIDPVLEDDRLDS